MSSNLSSSFHQFNFKVANATVHSVYVFDGFRLDGDKLMLYRGELPTALPPKAVETLLVLVNCRGEIVGKDELIEAVWRDSIVEDSNLTQYLYLIRKTLGARADGRQYIETLRKRGYRFNSDTFATYDPSHSVVPNAGKNAPARTAAEFRDNVYQFIPAPRESVEESPAGTRTRPGRFAMIVAAQAAVLIAGVAGAILWFNSRAVTEVLGQVNAVRLTNGIKVDDAVVSPDGKYFAYHELDGPRSRIWVQQTGHSTRLEIVPWRERRHGAKTFTPDGQFLYYSEADGRGGYDLFRVPTLGGSGTKVMQGVSLPVSFSPDGREFVFSRINGVAGEGQIGVRGTDGTGQERILFSSKKDDFPGAFVSWSPDGKSIAFSSLKKGSPTGGCSYYQMDLDQPEVKEVTNESWDICYRTVWSADGKGLFTIATKEGDGYSTRRDQLYYIPLTGGKSRRMTFDESRLQMLSLSVTNEGAVLVVPFNRSSQIWSMDANGDTRSARQITTGLGDGRAGIAPMADGRVAYVARTGENLSVWVMNSDGSDQRQLTAEPQYLEELRAGGDGRYLFFSAPEGRRNDLYRINTDGSEIRRVTSNGHAIDSGPSHDGKWLVYGAGAASGFTIEDTLWKLPIDGGEPFPLKSKNCIRPHYSPNDKFLSCVDDKDRLFVLSAEDGSVISSFPALVDSTLNFGARWAPDGRSLVYIATEKDVSNLWSQPVDGSAPRRLTDFNAGSIYHFAYSRDGKRLFLARGTQIRDAVLIDDSKK
jgi:Tol biopolymer transport system component/DNA-binding winged helix-turn-helix (wHTH) protein